MTMLQITYDGITEPDADQLAELRQKFSERHFVHLRGLIERSFLDQLADRIEQVEFREDLTENIGCVERCADPRIDHGMQFMLNQEPILKTVAAIVGKPVHRWLGNTVRRTPGANHFSNWHNDTTPPVEVEGHRFQRVVPLSLNLTREPFAGGNLCMRTVPDEKEFADIENKGPGDALLFRIGPDLQHRVADVEGTVPRLVHVGWFHERL